MVRSASRAPLPGASLFVTESNFQHVERGVRSVMDDSVPVLKPWSAQLLVTGLFALPVRTVAAESGAFPVESVGAEAGESLND